MNSVRFWNVGILLLTVQASRADSIGYFCAAARLVSGSVRAWTAERQLHGPFDGIDQLKVAGNPSFISVPIFARADQAGIDTRMQGALHVAKYIVAYHQGPSRSGSG